MSEDGGRAWRRVETFPGVPNGTYVTDVAASPRDVNTVFVALNNWQRGDYKPYLLKSTDRGRTFTSVAGNMPNRQPIFSVMQDHVNGNLLFVGTEFALFFTPDGGQRWVQLRGGLPTAQIRDMDIQRRETDLVLGTFGRSFYVLDDYSRAARRDRRSRCGRKRRCSRSAMPTSSRRWTSIAPPTATGRRRIRRTARCSRITCATRCRRARRWRFASPTRQAVRCATCRSRLRAGLRRVTWNLTGEPPAAAADARLRRAAEVDGGGGGGRGGGGGGTPVAPGRYFAQLVKVSGETVTPLGTPQSFEVRPLLK